MEKFGIFELLDTLSAILAGEKDAPAAQNPPPSGAKGQAEPPAAGQFAQGSTAAGQFAQGAPASTVPAQEPQASGSAAIASFLARHDEVSKKIDGK